MPVMITILAAIGGFLLGALCVSILAGAIQMRRCEECRRSMLETMRSGSERFTR
jgi:hypothetical protein